MAVSGQHNKNIGDESMIEGLVAMGRMGEKKTQGVAVSDRLGREELVKTAKM